MDPICDGVLSLVPVLYFWFTMTAFDSSHNMPGLHLSFARLRMHGFSNFRHQRWPCDLVPPSAGAWQIVCVLSGVRARVLITIANEFCGSRMQKDLERRITIWKDLSH